MIYSSFLKLIEGIQKLQVIFMLFKIYLNYKSKYNFKPQQVVLFCQTFPLLRPLSGAILDRELKDPSSFGLDCLSAPLVLSIVATNQSFCLSSFEPVKWGGSSGGEEVSSQIWEGNYKLQINKIRQTSVSYHHPVPRLSMICNEKNHDHHHHHHHHHHRCCIRDWHLHEGKQSSL